MHLVLLFRHAEQAMLARPPKRICSEMGIGANDAGAVGAEEERGLVGASGRLDRGDTGVVIGEAHEAVEACVGGPHVSGPGRRPDAGSCMPTARCGRITGAAPCEAAVRTGGRAGVGAKCGLGVVVGVEGFRDAGVDANRGATGTTATRLTVGRGEWWGACHERRLAIATGSGFLGRRLCSLGSQSANAVAVKGCGAAVCQRKAVVRLLAEGKRAEGARGWERNEREKRNRDAHLPQHLPRLYSLDDAPRQLRKAPLPISLDAGQERPTLRCPT